MGFIADVFAKMKAQLIGAVRASAEKEKALIQKIKVEVPALTPEPVTASASGFMFSYDDYVAMRLERIKFLKKRRQIIRLSHRKKKSQRRKGMIRK